MSLFPERRRAPRLLDVANLLRYEKKPGDPDAAAKQAEAYASEERKRMLQGAQPQPSGLRAQVPAPTPTTRMPAPVEQPANLGELKRPPKLPPADLDIGKNLPPAQPHREKISDDDAFPNGQAGDYGDLVSGIGKAYGEMSRMASGTAKGIANKAVDALPDWLRNTDIPNIAYGQDPYAIMPDDGRIPSVGKIGEALRAGAGFGADVAADPLTYIGGPAAKGATIAGKGLLGILSKAGIGKLAASAPAAGQFFRWLVGAAKAERKAGRLTSRVGPELEGWAIHAAEAGPEAAQAYFNKLKPDVQAKVLDELKAVHGAYEQHLAKSAAQKPPTSPGAPPKQPKPPTAGKQDEFVPDIDPDFPPEPPPERIDPSSLEEMLRQDRANHARQQAERARRKPDDAYDIRVDDVPEKRYRPVYGRDSDPAQHVPPGGTQPPDLRRARRQQNVDDIGEALRRDQAAQAPPGYWQQEANGAAPPPVPGAGKPEGQIGALRGIQANLPFAWRFNIPDPVKRALRDGTKGVGTVRQRWNNWANELAEGVPVKTKDGERMLHSMQDVRDYLAQSGHATDIDAVDGILGTGLYRGSTLGATLQSAGHPGNYPLPSAGVMRQGLTPAEGRIRDAATYPVRHPGKTAFGGITAYALDQLMNKGRASAALGVPSPSQIGKSLKELFVGKQNPNDPEAPPAGGVFDIRKPENDKRQPFDAAKEKARLEKIIAETEQRPGFGRNKSLKDKVSALRDRIEQIDNGKK